VSEDIIMAADVLDDIYRLPFSGYSLDVSHDETDELLRAKVTLAAGGEPETVLHMHSCKLEPKALADAQRRFSLVRAILQFLNTGGAVDDLTDTAIQLSCLTSLQLRDFELLDIHESVSVDIFLVDSAEQIVRVVPGAWAEPISADVYAELRDLFYCEDD